MFGPQVKYSEAVNQQVVIMVQLRLGRFAPRRYVPWMIYYLVDYSRNLTKPKLGLTSTLVFTLLAHMTKCEGQYFAYCTALLNVTQRFGVYA